MYAGRRFCVRPYTLDAPAQVCRDASETPKWGRGPQGEMFVELTREDLPGCQVKLSMSFEAAEVDKAFGKVYKELNDRGQVRGFRPGKVPRTLLLRHYGADAIRDRLKQVLGRDKPDPRVEQQRKLEDEREKQRQLELERQRERDRDLGWEL